MLTAAAILGIINLSLAFISILILLSIFIIVFKCRRELHDISLVLTCNTCLATFLTCIALFIMTISNLTTGFLTYNLHFCHVWGLLYDIFECSIYHSYYLQALFRLCRVVFYKKKALLSYHLYILLIIGQWLLTIILLIPPIPLKWYIRLPTEKYCLIPYTDVKAEIYHIIILYVIPLVSIAVIYVWITQFIRTSSHTSSRIIATQQRQGNLRDLTVIKRIVVLLLILVLLRFPTVIFMIYGVIAGQLYPLTYAIVGLITSACLIFIGLITIHITPQLRNNITIFLIHRDNRVHAQQTPLNQLKPGTTAKRTVFSARQNKFANARKDVGAEHKF